jgi:hypothetical protein
MFILRTVLPREAGQRRGGVGHISPSGRLNRLSRTATGHEAATLAERFILVLRLPYAIGCVVVGLGLFGILDVVFYHYAMSASLSEGLQKAFDTTALVTDILVAYSFYAPRYMRETLEEAGRSRAPLMSDREEGFAAFSPGSGRCDRR